VTVEPTSLVAVLTATAPHAFSEWYDACAAAPGVAAARAYTVTPRSGPGAAMAPYHQMALFRLGGTPRGALSGALAPPSGVRWTQYRFDLVDATTDRDLLAEDHVHFVFSGPPPMVSEADYGAWYHDHMRENVGLEGFTEGWRWANHLVRPDPAGRAAGPHLATYLMDRHWDVASKSISDARPVASAGWPDWFGLIDFSAVEAMPLGPLVTPPG
jgi:hypothetical protein